MADNNKLTDRQYRLPFVLITSLFFLWGFARAILDVLNKHFQDKLDISITQSGLIQVTTYLGYFIMAIPAGLFISKFGYRRGVVFGLILFGFGALSFIPASTFPAFLSALFVIGCGLTFLETAANPYVTELGPRQTASSRLNLSQTFNGMGCFMATLLVGQFLFSDAAGGDVSVPYGIMGFLVLVIAFVFTKVDLPEINEFDSDKQPTTKKPTPNPSPREGIPTSAPSPREGIPTPNPSPREGGLVRTNQTPLPWGGVGGGFLGGGFLFWFGLLALLAYEVAEISINSYFVNFVTGTGWMDNLGASRVVSLALVIFMVGRFLGSWIMRNVRAEVMLLCCAVGTVVCMLLTMLNLGMLSLVALILNYLFEAIMFPTIFSLAVRDLGTQRKRGASLLMMTPIGGCGFLLMGWLADHASSPFLPFIIPLAGYAVVMLYAYRMVRR